MAADKNDRHSEEEILGKAYDSRLAKRLWSYVGDQKAKLFWSVLLLLAGAAAEILGPWLSKIAIDTYIAQKDWNGLLKIVILFMAVAAAAAFLRWSQVYLTGIAGQIIMYRLRMQVFGKLQKLSIPYFDRNPVGRLMTRVTSDIQALYELFSSGLVAIFGDIFMLVGITIVMFAIHWKLALLTLSVLPLLLLATFVFRKIVRELYRQTRLQVAAINGYVQESLIGMRVIQLFGRESERFGLFDSLNDKLRVTYVRTVFYYAVFFPAVEIISAMAVAIIIFGGGTMMIAGSVTVGTLVAFLQYVERFYRPIRDLAEKYNILQSAMASSERIFQVLDHPIEVPELASRESSANLTSPLAVDIEFCNVWFAYHNEEWVLRDLSFRIAPGESVAIVGATGAGKTTIISLLLRYYDIQKGDIRIAGRSIREYSFAELRSLFGIVLQDVFIFAGTIEDNIRYGRQTALREDVIKSAEWVFADPFIQSLPNKYDEPVVERGATLSTGQRQLLAFARALLCDPKVLILDEATASIDTETEQSIQRAIGKLLEGRTSVIIAHRLSTIQRCDRILVLHHGKLREQGSHDQLLALGGIYHRLYRLQFGFTEESTEVSAVP